MANYTINRTQKTKRYCEVCAGEIAESKPWNTTTCSTSCRIKRNRHKQHLRQVNNRANDPRVRRQIKRSEEFESWLKLHQEEKPKQEPTEIQCKRRGWQAYMVTWPDCCDVGLFSMKQHHGVWRLHYGGKFVGREQRAEWKITFRLKRR